MNDKQIHQKKKQFIKICQLAGKTIKTFELIKPNDKILIALSGGKDSLALCEILAERKKHINFPFELEAIHIKATGIEYQVNEDFFQDFCDELNIPLTIKTIFIDKQQNPKKKTCFICSWNRRKAIFQFAREKGCNKLAFGHHADDAIQTMLMNMIYHASISSLPARLKMFDGKIELIRPMLEITEKDILDYTKLADYPEQIKSCPHEDKTMRDQMKQLVTNMEPLNKNLRKNLLRCTNKIFHEYLPGNKYDN